MVTEKSDLEEQPLRSPGKRSSLGYPFPESLVAFIIRTQRRSRKLACRTALLHKVNEKIHFRLSMTAQHS